jgi:hypothetical protein
MLSRAWRRRWESLASVAPTASGSADYWVTWLPNEMSFMKFIRYKNAQKHPPPI